MIIPVILSGGMGTRLWPVSRENHPKPFMKLADGLSLLQKTFIRASNLKGIQEILTITNREYYFKSKDEYGQVANKCQSYPATFLLEPFARNTAPAVLFAALKSLHTYGEDSIILILPADHLIESQDSFDAAYQKAITLAEAGKLVTFGILPTSPETGFGYMECGTPYDGISGSYNVKRYAEKPSLSLAKEYVESGRYLWNSGMFCFKVNALLDQFKIHAPKLLEEAIACWEISKCKATNPSMIELEQESFSKLTDISIDYALMEKSTEIVVISGDFHWNDIGSWDAVGKLVAPDERGNSVIGEAVLVDTHNTFIQSEHRIVASIGIEDLIIIDTADALLIADRNRTQDVKNVVSQLKSMSHESYKVHRTVTRPWGSYTVLEEGNHYKMKRIVVKPGASLSLQMHHHRSEHWVVVSGTAKIMNGDKEIMLNTNESTFIPAGHRHRLENPGVIDLILIEVQTGEYLGEDDIVRFEDKYGRA